MFWRSRKLSGRRWALDCAWIGAKAAAAATTVAAALKAQQARLATRREFMGRRMGTLRTGAIDEPIMARRLAARHGCGRGTGAGDTGADMPRCLHPHLENNEG